MHGIPRSCCNGQVVIPGSQSRELIGTLIVSRTAAGPHNPVHASTVVFHVENEARVADRLPRFINDFASKQRQRRETQHQVFGVEACAGHNGR